MSITQRAKGAFFLTMVIIIWVGSAYLIQVIFSSSSTEFNNPLFLTYFSTSFFTLYLIPLLYAYCKVRAEKSEQKSRDFAHEVKKVFQISLVSALFWFSLNYFYNLGLLYTSLTSSTIISNTSTAWVFLVSISCLLTPQHRAKICWKKAAFVLLSIVGIVVITSNDSSDKSSHDWLGDIFTMLSAILYALYATYLKVKVGPEEEERFHFSWFFGFIGLVNDVAILPLFWIFNATGIEEF
jgi:solute carrier family 35, member F5